MVNPFSESVIANGEVGEWGTTPGKPDSALIVSTQNGVHSLHFALIT
ncbi:MAG: hypothetical protein HRT87_11575 [Legionellales bacterium]|nr:hypothetical protein [Legionellales bacterium]